MYKREDIKYEIEIQEKLFVGDIEKMYRGNIILWLTCSGSNADNHEGTYRYLLQYNDYIKYYDGKIEKATANQSAIHGIIDAMEKINKPSRIYVVVASTLGFENAFNGKGVNVELFQLLYGKLVEKKCELTEVRFVGGADKIKKYVYAHSDNVELIQKAVEKQKRSEEYRNNYKEQIYEECKDKIINILVNAQVDESIVEKIRNLKP